MHILETELIKSIVKNGGTPLLIVLVIVAIAIWLTVLAWYVDK